MGLDINALIRKERFEIDRVLESGKKVAVDFSSLFYRILYREKNSKGLFKERDGKIISHTQGVLRYLSSSKIPVSKLYFVFDGKPTEEKRETMDKRRVTRKALLKKLEESIKKGDTAAIIKYQRQQLRITPEMIEDIFKIFDTLGIAYAKAHSEADFSISKLYKEGRIGAVISSDRDLLLHGIPLLIDIDQEEFVCLNETLKNIDWSLEQLITYGILLGTDYPGKAKGFGLKTGIKMVHLTDKRRPFETLPEFKKVELPCPKIFKKSYSLFKESASYGTYKEVIPKLDKRGSYQLSEDLKITSKQIVSFIERYVKTHEKDL